MIFGDTAVSRFKRCGMIVFVQFSDTKGQNEEEMLCIIGGEYGTEPDPNVSRSELLSLSDS